MPYNYAIEQLRRARTILAVSPGQIQDRVANAALSLVPIQPQRDSPDCEYREMYQEIVADITVVGCPNNSTIASVDDETAVAIASRLMGLLDGLELERQNSPGDQRQNPS